MSDASKIWFKVIDEEEIKDLLKYDSEKESPQSFSQRILNNKPKKGRSIDDRSKVFFPLLEKKDFLP